MNWNISAWCIRNPIPPIILFIILTVAGVSAYRGLSMEGEPNTDRPSVTVSVSELGAAPAELETQITRKIEDGVSGINGIRHINSSISHGESSTTIEFELGTNVDRATNDVREAITRVRQQLPASIVEPSVEASGTTPHGAVSYTVSSATRSMTDLSWMVDNEISRTLMARPAIGQVERNGGLEREILVNLDPVRLEAFGITADTVSTQLRALNVNLPGGRGQIGNSEQSIRTVGSSTTLEKLRNMRIALPGERWTALRLLGSVVDGSSEERSVSLLNGKPVLSIGVQRRRGHSVVDVESQADDAIKGLEHKFPDVKFAKIDNSDADEVRESCNATFESLMLGAVLAVVVIFLFLKSVRASIIAALAIPLSIVPTFACMKAAAFTLNDMSLLGLALVIGILVDDAIVEIENIVRHIKLGKKPFDAAIDAADEIGLAVVATTVASIVVFLPVAMMGGVPGLFFRQFGATVAVSVLFSLMVARLVTPLMAAYWLKKEPNHHDEDAGPLTGFYETAMRFSLKFRGPTLAIAVVFFASSVVMLEMMPTGLFASETDGNQAWFTIKLPPGSQLKETLAVGQRISAIAQQQPDTVSVVVDLGGDALNEGSGFINIKPSGKRQVTLAEFQDQLRPAFSEIPGAKVIFGSIGSDVQIQLSGYDPVALTQTAQHLAEQMRTQRGFTDVICSTEARSPELVVHPDFARAAEQGVSVEAIANTVLLATMGSNDYDTAKFDLSDRQIPIQVRLDPKYQHKLSVLNNMRILGASGRLIPLKLVAHVEFGSGQSKIERRDRARTVAINANLDPDLPLGTAMSIVHKLPALRDMPSSVKESPAGNDEIQRDLFSAFYAAIILGAGLIFAVLILTFRGVTPSLSIMMALPLALGGALIALQLFGKTLDLYALIGLVMLMGLVTKNAILLIEYTLESMRSGVPRTEAILLAGATRMRPIMMTTCAMVAGMLPIAVGIGAGAQSRSTMALAVVGGLVTSTLFTLVVIPVVFTYMDDLRIWLMKRVPAEHFNPDEADPSETTGHSASEPAIAAGVGRSRPDDRDAGG